MGYELRVGKTFADASGNIHTDSTNPTFVLDEVVLNKRKKLAILKVDAYKDASALASGSRPIYHEEHIVKGADYDTYFLDTVLAGNDVDPFDRGYAYLAVLHKFDIEGDDLGLYYADEWKTDEAGGVPQTIER